MLFPAHDYGGSDAPCHLLPVATPSAVNGGGCDRQGAYCSCMEPCGDSAIFEAEPTDGDSSYVDVDVNTVEFDVPCWEKDVNYDNIPEEELLASCRREQDDVDNEYYYDWDDPTSNVPFWWM